MTRSPPSRRRVLGSVGAVAAAALAGCNDIGGGGEPEYEAGTVGDVDADDRTAEETVAAEAVAEREINEGVTPLDVLSIRDHEFVLEEGYLGPTVQGTVENTSGDRVELVEVRVRVFDDGGAQLGRYLATTGDLEGNATWDFQVVLLESPADIAEYDLAVLGTPT